MQLDDMCLSVNFGLSVMIRGPLPLSIFIVFMLYMISVFIYVFSAAGVMVGV